MYASVSAEGLELKAILVYISFFFHPLFGFSPPASSTTNTLYSGLMDKPHYYELFKPEGKVEYIVFVGLTHV